MTDSITSTTPEATSPKRRRRTRGSLPWLAWPTTARVDGTAAPVEAINEAKGLAQVEQRDRWFRRSLAVADVGTVTLAVVLVVTVLGDDQLRPTSLLVLPFAVAVAKLQGLYDRDELLLRKTTIDEAPRLFQMATLCVLVFWLLDDVVVHGRLQTGQVLGLWALLSLLLPISRGVTRRLIQRQVPTERCVFVGETDGYERLRARLGYGGGIKAEFVGRLTVDAAADLDGEQSEHETDLRELIGRTSAHRLIIDTQALPPDEMLEFVRAAKGVGVRVSLLPQVLDVVGSSVVFDEMHGMTVLGVRRFGLTRSSRALKRGFDVVGSGFMLILLAPLMAVIAALVKLDSPGPVFFRQTRIGREGAPFRICKFRTMVADAEAHKAALLSSNEAGGGLFKIAEDPRVTRAGRLLRRTSLDELPQLLNVVRGDMSLVGPRPLVVDEDAKITGWDRRRLQLTPGMTGQWQIAGASRVPLPEMVKIDYVYVAGWSLWSDVKILLRTVPHVLGRRGL